MTKFELTAGDKMSRLWQGLNAHFEERLADARKRNDNTMLVDHDTAVIRGEIKCLKALIDLGLDRPKTDRDEQPPID